jgi:2-iminobutanoate/2-iminopropanoate deaminase
MMPNTPHDIGVATKIGLYSDAIEVPAQSRWLFTSGTPGLPLDGSLPQDITGQAEIAWGHIVTMLDRAGMGVQDLVKVTHTLTRAADIPAYVKVRARFLGDARHAAHRARTRASRIPARDRGHRRKGLSCPHPLPL